MVLKMFYRIFFVQILLLKSVICDVPQPAGGTCDSGKFQSPIHLTRKAALSHQFPDIKYENFHKPLSFAKLKNNGEGVELRVPNVETISISGGPMTGTYMLERIEWRWDESEHKIDYVRASLETQLVFRNRKYHSMEQAMGNSDGVVIMAALHTVGASSLYIKNLLQNFPQVQTYNSETTLNHRIKVRDIIPVDIQRYFAYRGSLTRKPCYESVQWIVFTDYMGIGNNEMQAFQNIKAADGSEIRNNFRGIQGINSRTVLYRDFYSFSSRRGKNDATMSIPNGIGSYIAVLSCQFSVVFSRTS